LTKQSRNQKKALVVISDGNDAVSLRRADDVRRRIRESDALVYDIGVDCEGLPSGRFPLQQRRGGGRLPLPIPLPLPPIGARRRPSWPPSNSVEAVAFSPEGRLSGSSARDLTIRLSNEA
jgi:hypothetical protein